LAEKIFVSLAIGTTKKNTATKTASGHICIPLATRPENNRNPLHLKPIWFLLAQKANTEKNQKSLNLASSDLKQKYK
jgi:hypothetical protein